MYNKRIKQLEEELDDKLSNEVDMEALIEEIEKEQQRAADLSAKQDATIHELKAQISLHETAAKGVKQHDADKLSASMRELFDILQNLVQEFRQSNRTHDEILQNIKEFMSSLHQSKQGKHQDAPAACNTCKPIEVRLTPAVTFLSSYRFGFCVSYVLLVLVWFSTI